METHHYTSESLIAVRTYAGLLADNFSDLWTDQRTVNIEVPTKVVFVGPSTGNTRPTQPAIRTKSTDSLNKYIADRMGELPMVERVYSKYEQKVFYTWIVIQARDRDAQRAIYAREKEIIRRFSDFGFDFYVIYRAGADVESLVSGDIELVYQKS